MDESARVNSNKYRREGSPRRRGLGIRQILTQSLNATGVVLARLLSPSHFGLFGIITFVLTFLVAFGDVGLGASLIREPGSPPKKTTEPSLLPSNFWC